jgi:hypothetical protein
MYLNSNFSFLFPLVWVRELSYECPNGKKYPAAYSKKLLESVTLMKKGFINPNQVNLKTQFGTQQEVINRFGFSIGP